MDHSDTNESATEGLEDESPEEVYQERTPFQNATLSTRRVSTRKSAQIKVFYEHHLVPLTIDSGAEVSMIRTSFAKYIGAPVKRTTQRALQADEVTPSWKGMT